MNILRIIIFGLLAFIERNPFLCFFLLIMAILAPAFFKVVGWIILGIIALFLLLLGIGWWRMRKMQREMNSQFKQSAGAAGFNTNFAGFNTQGMTLEEFVRQMQAQADASQKKNTSTQKSNTTKKSSVDSADYVDFEDIDPKK